MLLCKAYRVSIEAAKTLLMTVLHSSFQSERRIAPFVVLSIIISYHADRNSGPDSADVIRRAKLLSFRAFDWCRRDRLAIERVLAQ